MTATVHQQGVQPQTGSHGGVLAPFRFTLRTKGTAGSAARIATVLTRFGPTPRIMTRHIDKMIDLAQRAGFSPSCPTTATVLARHPASVRALADRGLEVAVHGLRHNDHLGMDLSEQTREIAKAVEVFRRFGIEPTGFRAPYLRADVATSAAVRAVGLSYESDDAVVFRADQASGAADSGAYQRALIMYSARDSATIAARPSLVDGLVRIPVCLPDDEMLIDRLQVTEHECAQVWSMILDCTHERGDLFTMQVHPERFARSAAGVEAVLSRARAMGGVWMCRMDEIAQWWRARDACRIEWRQMGGSTVTYTLIGDRRARMRKVGGHNVSEAKRQPTRTMSLRADRLPFIAVGSGVSSAARRFLEEDGYIVTAEPEGPCAVELTGSIDGTDQMALRRKVIESEHPLLAIDRWPDGNTSALALTGDIDALTMQDFVHRVRENAHGASAWITGERR